MDYATAHILCDLNTRFYAEHAASFSATRASGWPGWGRLVEELYGHGCAWADTQRAGTCAAERALDVRIVDAACGNLRFERWLAETLPLVDLRFTAIDNCCALAGEIPAGVQFVERDIVGALLSAERETQADEPLLLLHAVGAHQADLAVSFGFLHHVPTMAARIALLRALVEAVRPGGFVAVSLWRFADETGMRAKAEQTTQAGLAALGLELSDFEEGDYLLGWQDAADAYRYCHSFSDNDVDALVAALAGSAHLAERFKADGRTGALNDYLLFQRAF